MSRGHKTCSILALMKHYDIPQTREEFLKLFYLVDIVGISKESFAKAAVNAVEEATKTVREMKWARVSDLEMELDGKKITQYRAATKIYFDIEHS